MVKSQYLTGILKARIPADSSRFPRESACFEHPRFRVNQVFLTNMAAAVDLQVTRRNRATFAQVRPREATAHSELKTDR